MSKPIPCAIAVMAALAFAAPSASADPVEVVTQPGVVMCNDTEAGYCAVHVNAEPVTLTRHFSSFEVSFRCRVELDLEVFSNGNVTMSSEDLVDHAGGTGNCEDLVECDDPTDPVEWYGQYSHTGAQETITLGFCIDPPVVPPCESTVTINVEHTPVGAEEFYSFHPNDQTMVGTACELTGEFLNEGTPIEINHL